MDDEVSGIECDLYIIRLRVMIIKAEVIPDLRVSAMQGHSLYCATRYSLNIINVHHQQATANQYFHVSAI